MGGTGVGNPWRDEEGPEPLEAWLAAGFGREEAELWRSWRFPLAHARAWQAAGVADGLRAAQWTVAGVRPETVAHWVEAGIDATEAVRWHEFGFDLAGAKREKALGHSPVDVIHGPRGTHVVTGVGTGGVGPVGALMQLGVPHRILNSYLLQQWFDDEAVAWAKAHVDASDAQLWKALGVRPVEAGRVARRGLTVAQVVRQWWEAGIPFAEVADWLGAGLSAEEAAAQRASGITVEQAAALRALRDDDGA